MYSLLLLSTLVFLGHISFGNGLKCWLCSTQQNEACANPSIRSSVIYEVCPNPSANSRYVCRTVEFYPVGENRLHTSRGCFEEKDRRDVCSRQLLTFFAKVKSCSACGTDLCLSGETADFTPKPIDYVTRPTEPVRKFNAPGGYNQPPGRHRVFDDYATPNRASVISNGTFLVFCFFAIVSGTNLRFFI